MLNVLVVGAGAQGAPAAAILARQSQIGGILLASRDITDATSVRDRLREPKVIAAQVDGRDSEAIVRATRDSLGGADVLIDLTPSFICQPIMKAALSLGAHYVNTAACPEHLAQLIARRPLDLADHFVRAGKTALLSCGASPGAVNVICRRYCDLLETVERIEFRIGFHVPAQKAFIKTWTPSWSPEQQYFDYCDPPCLFHDGRHEHMPVFYDPETYDFGGNVGEVQLTHHAHDEQYSLPINIGKGIQYCCYKFPFEPAIATLHATGFTPERAVEINGTKVKALDVLMALLPRPPQVVMIDPDVQRQIAPVIADTRAHILIKGTAAGQAKTFRIETAAFYDQALKAVELFGSANIGVAYAAVIGALQLAEGKTKPGIVWPEELDPARFFELADSLGLSLNVHVS